MSTKIEKILPLITDIITASPNLVLYDTRSRENKNITELTDHDYLYCRICHDIRAVPLEQMDGDPQSCLLKIYTIFRIQVPEYINNKYDLVSFINKINAEETKESNDNVNRYISCREDIYEDDPNGKYIGDVSVTQRASDLSLAFPGIKFYVYGDYDTKELIEQCEIDDNYDEILMSIRDGDIYSITSRKIVDMLINSGLNLKIPSWFWKNYGFCRLIDNEIYDLKYNIERRLNVIRDYI